MIATPFRVVDARVKPDTACRIEFSTYAEGGRLAISLVCDVPQGTENPDGPMDGEPWLTATVNYPSIEIPVHCVTIPMWSEHLGNAALLATSGVIEPYPIGYIDTEPTGARAGIYRLTPAARRVALAGGHIA